MAIVCWLSTSFAQTTLTEAIDFHANDIGGAPWSLFQALDQGQYVCLFFYGVDCQFCQDVAPYISDAYQYFGCNQAQLIVLGINHKDTKEEVSKFEEDYDLCCPSISGLEDNGSSICELYDIQAHPTTVLIAPDRRIVETDIWPIPSPSFLIDLLESYGMVHQPCGPAVSKKYANNDFQVVVDMESKQLVVISKHFERMNNPQFTLIDLSGAQLYKTALISKKQVVDIAAMRNSCGIITITNEGHIMTSQKILLKNRE